MLLALWDDGVWQDAARVGGIVTVAYLLVMWVAALVWVYRDVESRTRDPFTQVISVLMVVVFNLPGLLLYLILRPKDTLADVYDRQLEAEALMHELQETPSCPACRRKIEAEFIACPYCRTALREPCTSCSRALAFGWVLCPFCGADRPQATPAARAASPARPAPAVAATAAPSTSSANVASQSGLAGRPAAASTTGPSTDSPPAPSPSSATPRPSRPQRRPSTATYTPPAGAKPPAPAPATEPSVDPG